MHRLRSLLQGLSPHMTFVHSFDGSADLPRCPPLSDAPFVHRPDGDKGLSELVDCFFYLFFPDDVPCPLALADEAAQGKTETLSARRMAATTRRMQSLLQVYITAAFILHGDPAVVKDGARFAPLISTSVNTDVWYDRQLRRGEDGVPCAAYRLAALTQTQRHRFYRQCHIKARSIVDKFVTERLPHVRWLLLTDVEALAKSDVAVTSVAEVVVSYPAVVCMVHQRVAHQLYLLGTTPLLTRALTERAHSLTGIDIHYAVPIGHHFFIDHGTGIIIGGSASIGNNVSLYQGVTLGARSFRVDDASGERFHNLPRHPIIEDNVTIYAYAVVLGRVTIGEGSVLGTNCVVMHDLPPNSRITQPPTYMPLHRKKKIGWLDTDAHL